MKLDRLIQILLPHDEKFYAFFEESASNLVRATDLLPGLFDADAPTRAALVEKIHEVEHQGDSVTHKIFAELSATFVTPFDREDIHQLASALDDVVDNIDGTASRVLLYKIQGCPPAVQTLVEILRKSVRELQKGVSLLRDFRKAEELQKVLELVNQYENEADDVFEKGIAELFDEKNDPIYIIKMKEIYVGLETATDKCEDAANVMESLLIKHA
jgi:predicted phosphate transport protein (TIGR00153 family)